MNEMPFYTVGTFPNNDSTYTYVNYPFPDEVVFIFFLSIKKALDESKHYRID